MRVKILNVGCATRTVQTLIAGDSAPAPWGPFLLFGQKKWTKEKVARMARHLPLLLAGIGARLNSPGANYAPRAQTRGSLLPIPAAMLGEPYGDQKTPYGFTRWPTRDGAFLRY